MAEERPTLVERAGAPGAADAQDAARVPGAPPLPRICLLNGTALPHTLGGTERQMQLLARELRRRGHEVLIVTYRTSREWPREETIEGVPVVRTGGLYLGGKLRRRWGMAVPHVLYELWRRRDRYDVIQAQQTLELGFAAAVAGRRLGKPAIARLSSSGRTSDLRLMEETYGAIGRAMARAVVRSSATMVAVTAAAVADLRAAGIPETRIRLIPNGIDAAAYAAGRPGAAGEPIRRVVCVGHLEPVKGVDVLLRAWARVRGELPDAVLQVVGGGSQAAALDGLCRQLGIQDGVEFAGDVADVRPYLARAQLFALPSRAEGMPNALLEAMASGLPCVATRVGACPELIEEGVTGYLAEPESPDGLARALLAAMRAPERTGACARAGLALVRGRYSLDGAIASYEELYRQLCVARAPMARG
jgi:glycosyltransferase involved in cell wall biosynthesis